MEAFANLRVFSQAAKSLLEKNYVGIEAAKIIKDLVRFSEEVVDRYVQVAGSLQYLRKQNQIARLVINDQQFTLDSIYKELAYIRSEAKFVSQRNTEDSRELNQMSGGLLQEAADRLMAKIKKQKEMTKLRGLRTETEISDKDQKEMTTVPSVQEAVNQKPGVTVKQAG